MPVLQTERLLLRPFEEADLDEYADIVADREVNRYSRGVMASRLKEADLSPRAGEP
jgi:RimJ/RimL family protein N-acetyltransferase